MIIDFNKTKELIVFGMNNGSGDMSAKMYIDNEGEIIPCAIHVGAA